MKQLRARNVIELFLSTKQITRSWFVRSLTKMADEEGSFEEMFSETVLQFPVINGNVLFSLDTRSLRLRLFLPLFLRR